MEKTDMKKTLKDCYSKKKSIYFVEVPSIQYITFSGQGDPNTSELFQDAMQVLYGLAYTIKFAAKEKGKDFTVMPLEGQWWTDPPEAFSEARKDLWLWKTMIAVPDFISKELFEDSKAALKKKKNPRGLEKAGLETITDGFSAQFLYIGPYSGEAPYIAQLHKHIQEKGYTLRGKHREIYMNSPRQVSEDKLKTIIRHPVQPS